MCLARTRNYKRFRDESFHLTGFAGQKHTNHKSCNHDAGHEYRCVPCRETLSHSSLANTCRTRASVEFARAKSLSAASWKHDELQIGQCQCHNLNLKIANCQWLVATALWILQCTSSKMNANPTNSQKCLRSLCESLLSNS